MSFDILLQVSKFFLVSLEDFFLEVGVNTFVFVVFRVDCLPVLEDLQFLLQKDELLLVGAEVHVQEVVDKVWQLGIMSKIPHLLPS